MGNLQYYSYMCVIPLNPICNVKQNHNPILHFIPGNEYVGYPLKDCQKRHKDPAKFMSSTNQYYFLNQIKYILIGTMWRVHILIPVFTPKSEFFNLNPVLLHHFEALKCWICISKNQPEFIPWLQSYSKNQINPKIKAMVNDLQ